MGRISYLFYNSLLKKNDISGTFAKRLTREFPMWQVCLCTLLCQVLLYHTFHINILYDFSMHLISSANTLEIFTLLVNHAFP